MSATDTRCTCRCDCPRKARVQYAKCYGCRNGDHGGSLRLPFCELEDCGYRGSPHYHTTVMVVESVA